MAVNKTIGDLVCIVPPNICGDFKLAIWDICTLSTYQSSIGEVLSGVCGTSLFTLSSGYQSTIRVSSSNIASGNCSGALIGLNNCSSGGLSTVVGGVCNTASGCYSTLVGGNCNISSGCRSAILAGDRNCATGAPSFIGGGFCNVASAPYASIMGGGRNCASCNNTFIGAGFLNCATGWVSAIGGGCCNATTGCYSSVVGGGCNTASAHYSSVLGGYKTLSYLYGQQSQANGAFSFIGDSQKTQLVARKTATLSSGGTTKLSLDGTGVTNLLIPDGTNRVWGVEINAVSTASVAGGTVALGNSFQGKYVLLFKKIGGVSTIVGVNTATSTYDTNMSTATFTFSVGASQDLEINFNAPTTATSTTFKIVATLSITEVAY
jgi:hypothetical protein